jgi:ATP/maltotriose-dependent transcriptional regulator MalT
MMNLRPQVSPLHLARSRLVRQLPSRGGHVVWLEAPYGYGKSVLSAQWAHTLEAHGWRVLWLAPSGLDVRSALARVLDYPPDVPWLLLLDALWQTPTLLVLEDLDGSEQLSPLLKTPHGLILLASRGRLPEPELPRLRAEGRLIHLTATDLAFTLPEATRLFTDPSQAASQWERTLGWPLPLQLAALTGATSGNLAGQGKDDLAAQAPALLRGIRESLEPVAWDEVLFLSSLKILPGELATSATQEVARAGFAQILQGAYRLHPLTAELLLGQYPAEVQRVVVQETARLPPMLRGEAYEHAGLRAQLAELLESDPELAESGAETVLRWDALAGGDRGVVRLCNVGEALGFMRREREAADTLLKAAERSGNTSEQTLTAYRNALWWLLNLSETERAREVVERAEALLDRVDPGSAARFLNNAGRIYFDSGDHATGEATIQAALARLEVGHPRYLPILMNLMMFRYYLYGDLEGRMALYEEVLNDEQQVMNLKSSRSTAHYDLGRQSLLLGDLHRATRHFQQAVSHAHNRPPYRLAAQGFLYLLNDDYNALPGLLTQLQRWEDFGLETEVRGIAALRLVNLGRFKEALMLAQASPEGAQGVSSRPVVLASLALALHGLGRTAEAEMILQSQGGTQREALLYWYAARYRVQRNSHDLDALIGQTLMGARLLPALVPLSHLPRERPELSDAYLVRDVLSSGWKASIQRRLHDAPPLELRLLGGFEVRVLDASVTLTQRPRELLTLLLLGQTREQAAEAMWPDLDVSSLRNNLNFTVSSLRRQIEPWGQASYLLPGGLTRVHSDLSDLRAALNVDDGQAILALYKGDLAPVVDLPAVNALRETLRSEVVRGLIRAARTAPARAETFLERALTIEPESQSLAEELRQVLNMQGREGYARERYTAWTTRKRSVLGDEFPD